MNLNWLLISTFLLLLQIGPVKISAQTAHAYLKTLNYYNTGPFGGGRSIGNVAVSVSNYKVLIYGRLPHYIKKFWDAGIDAIQYKN